MYCDTVPWKVSLELHNPEFEPWAVAPSIGRGRNWKEADSNPQPSVRRPKTLTNRAIPQDILVVFYTNALLDIKPKSIDSSRILHKKALLEITPKSIGSSGILHKKALTHPIQLPILISIPIPKPVPIKGAVGNDTDLTDSTGILHKYQS